MKQTLNIVDAIKEEISRLERALALAMQAGDEPPGESHIKRIRALIADLEREIELNTPRP